MAKYAKWIGGGLGWAVGGPIGAILGFAIGSMFDSSNAKSILGKATGTQTRQGDFMASLLVLSAGVMKADGKVLKSELDYVRNFYEKQFGSEAAKENIPLLKDILKQDIPLEEIGNQIGHNMDSASRLQLLHYLFGIAGADGQIHSTELNVLERIRIAMRIRPQDFESIKAMFIKDNGSNYKILEVSSDATDEEVKKAYRKMAVKYHPDKVSHLGENVQKAAKEKFQKVQAAYDAIKKERNM